MTQVQCKFKSLVGKLVEVLVKFTDFTSAFLSSTAKLFTAAPSGQSGQDSAESILAF